MWKTHSRRKKSLYLISVSNHGMMAHRTDSRTSITRRLQPRGAFEDECKRTNFLLPPGRIVGLNWGPVSWWAHTSRRSSEWSCCSFTLRRTSWDHWSIWSGCYLEISVGRCVLEERCRRWQTWHDMLVGIIFHICLKTREAGQTYCNCYPSDPDTHDPNQDKSKTEIMALVTIFNSRV